MKKILLFIGVLALSSFMFVNAQISVLSSSKLLSEEGPTLRATYATITCEQTHYEPGDTVLTFHYHHNIHDDYTGGISLKFPEGVEVISATAISGEGEAGGLVWMGATGDGVLTHWGNITNPSWPAALRGNASGTVSVIVDESFSGKMNIDWTVVSDGANHPFGTPPFTSSGTITLYQGFSYDMAVENITPNLAFENHPVIPTVTVINYGINPAEEYSVTLTDNESYNETINIAEELESGNSYTIEFPEWAPSEGSYVLTATVDFENDGNPDNNILEKDIEVYGHDPIFAKIVAYNGTDFFPGTYYMGTSVFNTILPASTHIYGGTVIGDNLYGITSTGDFGYFSEDMSSWNNIGATGTTNLFSMAYDRINEKVYSLRIAQGATRLFEINKNTGVAIEIGVINQTGIIYSIAAANNGDLYGIMFNDNSNGELYKIDKTTAELTLIGDLGEELSAHFPQMCFDPQTNICYLQAFDSEDVGRMNGTYIINLETGQASLFGDILNEHIMALGIPGELGGPHILSTIPEDGETDVAIDTEISATFDVDIFGIDLTEINIEPEVINLDANIDGATVQITYDMLEYNTTYTVTIPAGSISDGSLELFYDVVWSFTTELDPLACNTPTDLQVDNITAYTAELSWQENGPAESWEIEYGPTGFTIGQGEIVVANSNPYVLEGLSPETTYDFYVTSLCEDDESHKAGPVSFTTTVSCFPPTDLSATKLSDTSYELSWTAGDDETIWNVEYGLYGYTPGTQEAIDTYYGITTNTWVVTDLNENSTYEFYVQADCGEIDGESVWVGPFIFNEFYLVATYDEGNISVQHVHPSGNWFESDCPGSLFFNIPDGFKIRAVDVSYDIKSVDTSPTVNRKRYQRSRLKSIETSTSIVRYEPSETQGQGNDHGVYSYNRNGLTFANGLKGEIEFQLHAGGTWPEVFGRECRNTHHYVVNETWTMKIYLIEDPSTEIIDEDFININIYPNPSSGTVYVQVNEMSLIRIMDISGRLIETYQINAFETLNFNQSKGMYIIQVESKGKVSNHKIIIQ